MENTDCVQSGEQWKPIAAYEGTYEVSSAGRVRSRDRLLCCGPVRGVRQGSVLAHSTDRSGYSVVGLCREGQVKTMRVHRLVATAFVCGRNDARKYVNHKNGIKTDNRAENLEWCSASENVTHAYRVTGANKPRRGTQNHNASFSDEEILQIRAWGAAGHSETAIGRMVGRSPSTIGHILRRTRWSHISERSV